MLPVYPQGSYSQIHFSLQSPPVVVLPPPLPPPLQPSHPSPRSNLMPRQSQTSSTCNMHQQYWNKKLKKSSMYIYPKTFQKPSIQFCYSETLNNEYIERIHQTSYSSLSDNRMLQTFCFLIK